MFRITVLVRFLIHLIKRRKNEGNSGTRWSGGYCCGYGQITASGQMKKAEILCYIQMRKKTKKEAFYECFIQGVFRYEKGVLRNGYGYRNNRKHKE